MKQMTDEQFKTLVETTEEQAAEKARQQACKAYDTCKQRLENREQEVLLMLREGISWRRLAALLAVSTTTLRRVIADIPEMANAKNTEGWGAELLLARLHQQAENDLSKARDYIRARASYNANRAKDAYYNALKAENERQEREKRIKDLATLKTREELGQEPPTILDSAILTQAELTGDLQNALWHRRRKEHAEELKASYYDAGDEV